MPDSRDPAASPPTEAAPWRHGVALWMLIAAAESMNGMLRELYLQPWLGTVAAKQVGMAVGTVLILSIAFVFAPWLRATTTRARLLVGATWLALTVAFEALLALWLDLGVEQFLADYDPTRGGLMLYGLFVLLLAPTIGAWLQRRGARRVGAG